MTRNKLAGAIEQRVAPGCDRLPVEKPPEVRRQGVHGRIAPFGFASQRFECDGVEIAAQLSQGNVRDSLLEPSLAWRRWFIAVESLRPLGEACRYDGRACPITREKFVKQATDAVHVGCRADRIS